MTLSREAARVTKKTKDADEESLSLIVCGGGDKIASRGNFMAANDLKTLLGSAIKAYRASLGISQEELARRAGLHRTYVSDLERGARNPSIESIEKLARALEISVAALFAAAGNGKH